MSKFKAILLTVVTSIIFTLLLLLLTISISQAKITKVVVMDTGLDLNDYRLKPYLCKKGHKDFTGTGLKDNVGHGTFVTGIITEQAKKHNYCIVVVKFWDGQYNMNLYLKALAYSVSLKPKYVNLSLSGGGLSKEEYDLIRKSKATFVVAAGNGHSHFRQSYPGGYHLKNVIPVGNYDCFKNKINSSSNYGEGLIYRCGTKIISLAPNNKLTMDTGTSFSAPVLTGELLRGKK